MTKDRVLQWIGSFVSPVYYILTLLRREKIQSQSTLNFEAVHTASASSEPYKKKIHKAKCMLRTGMIELAIILLLIKTFIHESLK